MKAKRTLPMNRRQFLFTTTVTMVGTAVAPAYILADQGGAWTMQLATLSPDTARTLLQMARDIYPHDILGDEHYVQAIKPYDEAAKGDAELKKMIGEGITELDDTSLQHTGKRYLEVNLESERTLVLARLQHGPLFQKVRGDMVVSLYNQKELWSKFGYEGASWEQGGYLERGFNDIDWV